MGFQREAPTLLITFQGSMLEGLEVETKPVGRATFRRLAELHDQLQEGDTGLPADKQAWEAFDTLVNELEAVLLSWNLENSKGEPTPCNAEELDRQGIEFVLAVLTGWFLAVDKHTQGLASRLEVEGFDQSEIPMEAM